MTKLSKPIVIWTGMLTPTGECFLSSSVEHHRFRVVVDCEAHVTLERFFGVDALGVEAWVLVTSTSDYIAMGGQIRVLKRLVSELTVKNIYERQQREEAKPPAPSDGNPNRRSVADKIAHHLGIQEEAPPQVGEARGPKKGPRKR